MNDRAIQRATDCCFFLFFFWSDRMGACVCVYVRVSCYILYTLSKLLFILFALPFSRVRMYVYVYICNVSICNVLHALRETNKKENGTRFTAMTIYDISATI